jgi:hypothetical protein
MQAALLNRARRTVVVAGLLAAALMSGGRLGAASVQQPGLEASVMAAFLYNFAKFTEWPALGAGTPISMCVVADTAMADAVAATVRGERINGHPLDVSRPQDTAAWAKCHLLFISGEEIRRFPDALGRLKASPVLTVSDGRTFSGGQGIIELYVDSGKMRFAINVDAADRAGVRISSRLLGLAKIVRNFHAF